jgi:hypothetical protein
MCDVLGARHQVWEAPYAETYAEQGCPSAMKGEKQISTRYLMRNMVSHGRELKAVEEVDGAE